MNKRLRGGKVRKKKWIGECVMERGRVGDGESYGEVCGL